jgi:hypothetical protein
MSNREEPAKHWNISARNIFHIFALLGRPNGYLTDAPDAVTLDSEDTSIKACVSFYKCFANDWNQKGTAAIGVAA